MIISSTLNAFIYPLIEAEKKFIIYDNRAKKFIFI